MAMVDSSNYSSPVLTDAQMERRIAMQAASVSIDANGNIVYRQAARPLSQDQLDAAAAVAAAQADQETARVNAIVTAATTGGTVDENGMVIPPAKKVPAGPVSVSASSVTGAAVASTGPKTTPAATGSTTDPLGLGKGLDLGTVAGADTYTKRQNAYAVLTATFKQYGIDTLAPKILDYVTQGYQSDTISLLLQDTPEYKTRFVANDARVKAGLPVLSPADYINNENAYRQYMAAAGLPKGFYDQQADFTKFIASDVSPTELNNRIQTAATIIQNTNPMVTQSLQQYYGLSQGDMIAHVLDPEVSRPLIQKQVASAQIGAAAQAQGLGVNATTAENLYGQGVTQAQAQQGFANVALNQTPMQKLAQIWGGDAAVQGQNLVASTFGTAGSAYAEQQIKALTTRETSAFGGSAGAGKGSLGGADTSGLN